MSLQMVSHVISPANGIFAALSNGTIFSKLLVRNLNVSIKSLCGSESFVTICMRANIILQVQVSVFVVHIEESSMRKDFAASRNLTGECFFMDFQM